MRNKWFVALLLVVVMVCACWTGVLAEDVERETFTSGDYKYALLDDGTVEITDYKGKAKELTIPDMLDGKKVSAIGNSAFYSCDSLTSVSIPDSVTSIGDSAFYSCTSLTSVSIPDSVTSIGDRAFFCCISLTSVTIPDSVTSIGDGAFLFCPANLTLTVPRNSYALDYAKANNIPYTYPDANDWLNN